MIVKQHPETKKEEQSPVGAFTVFTFVSGILYFRHLCLRFQFEIQMDQSRVGLDLQEEELLCWNDLLLPCRLLSPEFLCCFFYLTIGQGFFLDKESCSSRSVESSLLRTMASSGNGHRHQMKKLQVYDKIHGIRAGQETEKKTLGFIEAVVSIGKQEGVKGYWKGNLAQVLRILPYSVVQLFAYESYKKLYAGKDGELSVIGRLAAGASAGMTSTFVTYPLDVLRLRMAVDPGYQTMTNVKSGPEGFMIKMRDGRHLRCAHNNPQGGHVVKLADFGVARVKAQTGVLIRSQNLKNSLQHAP
ncbi:hypothetical protein L2E82_38784 [Cichorium intybus]|uniref:Uncharacterized protein n=1 Tax=Cichorium intybus TaxID=13427 RepID=A0ACB9AGG7_CICIN|nr:hypothetical protein L2E82_38784 [Cichorium intybus]